MNHPAVRNGNPVHPGQEMSGKRALPQGIVCGRRNVTLTPKLIAVVKLHAAAEGVGFSEMLRTIIREWDKAQPKPVVAAAPA